MGSYKWGYKSPPHCRWTSHLFGTHADADSFGNLQRVAESFVPMLLSCSQFAFVVGFVVATHYTHGYTC